MRGKTFIDALSYFNSEGDGEAVKFLEYILMKYFDRDNFFMLTSDAIPYLDSGDKKQMVDILRVAP